MDKQKLNTYNIYNLEENINNTLNENGYEFHVVLGLTSYIKISYEDRFKNCTTSYFTGKTNVGTDFGAKIEQEYYSQEIMDVLIDFEKVYNIVVNEYEK